jgi:sugar phosphate isomerase/epimerase
LVDNQIPRFYQSTMKTEFKLGLMTGTFYATNLLEHLDRIQGIGYEVLEIWCYEPHFYYQDEDFIRRAIGEIEKRNLQVRSLHATFHGLLDLSGPDKYDRVHALETVKKQTEITSRLGGEVIVLHPGGRDVPFKERRVRLDYFLEAMESLVPWCHSLGIKIAVENMGPGYLGDDFEEMGLILNSFPGSDVGLCLDTSHAHLTGNLLAYLEWFGDRILTFHISDNHGRFDDHLPPGRGEIDWPEFLTAVWKTGFRGPLVLEVLDKSSIDLYRSIEVARDNLEGFLLELGSGRE